MLVAGGPAAQTTSRQALLGPVEDEAAREEREARRPHGPGCEHGAGGDQQIGDGTPGELTRKLQKAFEARIQVGIKL